MLSKTFSSIRISGLMGLALATACGGDEEPSANPPANGGFDAAVTTPEAGSGGRDAGTSTGVDAGQCLNTPLGSGVACTPAGGGYGYRTCVNGVPTGECVSVVPEGGINFDAAIDALRDSGIINWGEGGLTVGDATITLPEGGAIKCPAPFMCLDAFKQVTGGLSACGEAGGILPLPPAGDCTTGSGPCKLGGVTGMCVNAIVTNACVVVCN
jgi:hypothetical protein